MRLLRAWLGSQVHVLDSILGNVRSTGGAVKSRLDLLDIFVGAFGRLAKATKARGGAVIHIGYSYGQDLSDPIQVTLCLALWVLLKPRHTWCSFPCTPWCAWSRLNVAG